MDGYLYHNDIFNYEAYADFASSLSDIRLLEELKAMKNSIDCLVDSIFIDYVNVVLDILNEEVARRWENNIKK